MSGEVVIAPALMEVGLGGAAAGLAAGALLGAAVIGVQLALAHRDNLRAEAERAARARKQALDEWQDWQQQEQQLLEKNAARQREAQSALDSLKLRIQDEQTRDTRVKAQGFVHAVDHEQLNADLNAMGHFVAALPASLRDDQRAPLARLNSQLQRLKQQLETGETLLPETLADFQRTLQGSLERYQHSLEQENQHHAQRLQQVSELLDAVLIEQHLAQQIQHEQFSGELQDLRQHLLTLLSRGEVSASTLEVLQRKFSQVQQALQQAVEQAALRESLRQRLHHHLQRMGYQLLEETDATQSVWRIPGGEQVRAVAHADGRMAFQVIHERAHASDAALSMSEMLTLRHQEKRWCSDAKQIVRALVEDGFAYEYQFERDVPEASIPIAVVESADDLLEQEQRRRASRGQKRYLDK